MSPSPLPWTTDDHRPPREPVFLIPGVVTGLLVLMLAIHVLRGFLDQRTDNEVLFWLSFIPVRLFDPDRAAAIGYGRDGMLLAGLPLVTHAFLHADWTHIGLNATWMAVFGTPFVRRAGAMRFLLLFVLGAIAGGLAHGLADMASPAPLVGASGGISALMGAVIRFGLGPVQPGRGREHGQTRSLADPRILLFAAAYIVTNWLFATASPTGFMGEGGRIAWEAHLGGFLFGLLLFPIFDRRPDRFRDLT